MRKAMPEALARPWDQAQADQWVAAVIDARVASFGRPEWPADKEACQVLGQHYDVIDHAWLSKDWAALERAVGAALALIVQLGLQNVPKPSALCGGTVSPEPYQE
jgi:hypothetical protein